MSIRALRDELEKARKQVEIYQFDAKGCAAERDELRAALEGLVNRLDEIGADPDFRSVFTLHYVHGGDYRGPTWVEALAAARKALE